MEFKGYHILGQLQETFYFDFYEAKNLQLDLVVVIKVLKAKFVNDSKIKKEFIKNTREMAKVKFAFLPEIYDVVDDGDLCYASMEYSVVAPTLTRTVNRQKIVDQEDVLMIAAWLSQSLTTSWNTLKLPHKSLTPDKIAIQEDGTLVLFDLGTTKNTEPEMMKIQLDSERIVVQPYFLAPEQIDCLAPSDKTDMYAMGMILYYMLTGTAPFSECDPMDVLKMHKTGQLPPPSLSNPSVTHQMELLIGKLTMKDPADRFYHWEDFSHAISLIKTGENLGITFDKSQSSTKIAEVADKVDKTVEVVESKDEAVIESVEEKKKITLNREHAQKNRTRHKESLIPDAPIPFAMHLIMLVIVVAVWIVIAGIVNYRYLSKPVFEQPQIRQFVDKIMPE
ncbi:MAG: protein kinase [Kiritimatiellae bacterium]|jgi:serine/threonine protein kinase|nr:protein kinase [Kiritimatiellia bacterium]